MNPFEILGVVILAALGLWQLSTAWSRGEVRGRYGAMIRRADEPTHFWMIVAVSALFPLMCAALAVVLAWRALYPLPLAQRESALYPTRAARQNASGLVVLNCTVTPAYGLKDCSVGSETPPGLGFGASALQVSALQILPQKDRAHATPGSRINLPIRFKMPTPPSNRTRP
jgi:hypothetical protein